jgi:hypothetical protein
MCLSVLQGCQSPEQNSKPEPFYYEVKILCLTYKFILMNVVSRLFFTKYIVLFLQSFFNNMKFSEDKSVCAINPI